MGQLQVLFGYQHIMFLAWSRGEDKCASLLYVTRYSFSYLLYTRFGTNVTTSYSVGLRVRAWRSCQPVFL